MDGSLKSQEKLQVNVVEDGVAIRLRAEEMASLVAALEAGRDFLVEDPAMVFSLQWTDSDADVCDALGRLVSPVDGAFLGVSRGEEKDKGSRTSNSSSCRWRRRCRECVM